MGGGRGGAGASSSRGAPHQNTSSSSPRSSGNRSRSLTKADGWLQYPSELPDGQDGNAQWALKLVVAVDTRPAAANDDDDDDEHELLKDEGEPMADGIEMGLDESDEGDDDGVAWKCIWFCRGANGRAIWVGSELRETGASFEA